MKKNSAILLGLIMFPLLLLAEEKDISALFFDYHIKGSLLISSLNGEIEYSHHDASLNQRFLPASTFKIPNTLIALNHGAIQHSHEIIKWDGIDRGWDSWNKDQTLATAFSVSCVWCYQRFAKKIGRKNYAEYLTQLSYGNKKIGKDLTSFWLDGDLAISVREQVNFLKRLYRQHLPFKAEHMQILKKIMLVKQTDKYSLYAKTGWAARIAQQHGWYVGYIEVGKQVWFFANRININTKQDLKYRQHILLEALKLKGIIEKID